MRASRRLSLSTHGAVEAAAGMAIMLSPIVLPVGAGGLVALAVIGAVVTGVGLGLISSSARAGAISSHGDSIGGHVGADGVLVLLSAGAALALALVGQTPAALALAGLVAVQVVLNFTTSYATPG
ncbi:MAG TPA: hypothetical protein VG325_04400 [Solirubrobacteraceae bacterium]|nr:hypothetical protein [Solirubrobacteraceae bacterium]